MEKESKVRIFVKDAKIGFLEDMYANVYLTSEY